MSFLSYIKGAFPFGGQPPTQYASDAVIIKSSPGVEFYDQTGAGFYGEHRFTGSAHWSVINAQLGSVGWQQMTTTLPSFALLLTNTGQLQVLSAPAGAPIPIVWTTTTLSPSLLALAGSASAALSGSGLQTFSKPYTIPAGALNIVGTILRVRASATFTNTSGSSGTLQPGFSLGGNLAAQANGAGNIMTGTTGFFEWEQDFIVTATGTATQMIGRGTYGGSITGNSLQVYAPQAVVTPSSSNLAAALVVVPNVTFGGAAAGNVNFSCTGYQFSVEVLYPGTVL